MLLSKLSTVLASSWLFAANILSYQLDSLKPANEYGHLVHHKRHGPLQERSPFDFSQVTGGDLAIIRQGFVDLSNLINIVVANPNQNVLQNYFDPNDANDVASIFTTVQQMIGPGGVPNPPHPGFGPTNLNQIQIKRDQSGCSNPLVLANSVGVGTSATSRTLTICNFGWNVVWFSFAHLLPNVRRSVTDNVAT